MDTLEKAGLPTIGRLLRSGIPIYNFEVPDRAGRKTRIRIIQAIAKHADAITFNLTYYPVFQNVKKILAELYLFTQG